MADVPVGQRHEWDRNQIGNVFTNQAGVDGGFFDVLGDARDEGGAVLKVGVEVSLIDDGTGLGFDARLLVGQRQLVQHLHVGLRVAQRNLVLRRHVLPNDGFPHDAASATSHCSNGAERRNANNRRRRCSYLFFL